MALYTSTMQWMGGNGQNVAYTVASATQSAALPTGTTAIRIVATTDVYIEISLGSSASAGQSGFLPAGVVEYVPIGEGNFVSMIGSTVDGTLNIKPCCG